MLVSVIIVNYNARHFTEQCLCSVFAAIEQNDIEVIVVDNASQDGSADFLEANFPSIKLIRSEANLGFGKANNLAIRMAAGEFVLLLNPDTLVPEDIFRECLNWMKKDHQTGAIGVRMLDGSGSFLPESKRSFPSPLVSFWKMTGMSSVFRRSAFFNRYALGHLEENGHHSVDVLSGAFMFCRKTPLITLGGFDERFFMYGEDIDLSYRLKQAGWKNDYLGSLSIVHFKGESTQREGLKYIWHFYEAMHLFVKKHYQGPLAGLLTFALQTAIIGRGLISFVMLPLAWMRRNNQKTNAMQHTLHMVGGSTDRAAVQKLHPPGTRVVEVDDLIQVPISAQTIVFCLGQLSYKQAIAFISLHSKKFHFRWFGNNSKSVVGSDSETTTGYVLWDKKWN
jgi:GT2 family glycosyltransferase